MKYNYKFKICNLLFLFTLLLLATPEANSITLERKEFPYSLQRVSPIGGICLSGIKDFKQDTRGFIWVISDAELFRFDGYTFKRYTNKLQEVASLFDWSIMSLEIDDNDCIYIGLLGGVVRYNTRNEKIELIYSGIVSALKYDGRDKLWITGDKSGYYDLKSNSYIAVKLSSGKDLTKTTCITLDNDNIYIASKGNLYLRKKGETCFSIIYNNPSGIIDITQKNNKIYILTEESGLYILDKKSQKIIDSYFFYVVENSRMPTKSVYIDGLNRIWIAAQKGIYLIDPYNHTFALLNIESDITKRLVVSSIWKIKEDRQGNIWFGTYSGGLYLIDFGSSTSFVTYSLGEKQLNCPIVSSIVEQGNILWIGTEGGGINKLDKASAKITYITHRDGKNSLAYNNVKSMLLHENKLWISTFRGGLDCYDINKGSFVNYSASQPSHPLLLNHVHKIVENGSHGFLMCYRFLSLTFYSYLTKQFTHYSFKQGNKDGCVSGQGIMDVTNGQDDNMWVATDRQIYNFNTTTGKIKALLIKNSSDIKLKNLRIKSITVGQTPNILWIGTYDNGLWRYDSRECKLTFCIKLNVYQAHSINSLLCDKEGKVWLGSDNGLFFYNPKTGKLLNYNKSDGIQGNLFCPYAATLSQSGSLYFGGTEGITIIDPKQISTNKFIPKPIITNVLIDRQSPELTGGASPQIQFKSEKDHLVLNHQQQNFSIEFTSNSFLSSEKNRFRYCLKGYDNHEIEVDAFHREASYSKISSGNYIFEIRVANSDGVWGPVKQVYIKVLPPWWLSNLAIFIYIIIILVSLWYIVKYLDYRRKEKFRKHTEQIEQTQKEERHREQLRFFTNVSHDLRTPLSLIMAALDSLPSDLQKNRFISVIRNSVKRLLNMVNELMDFRILQEGKMRIEPILADWNKFVEDRTSDFKELALQKGLKYSISLDTNIPQRVMFDNKVVEKILFNLLNNSFKYTYEGEISVKTFWDARSYQNKYDSHVLIEAENNTDNTYFGIIVSDTGIGISEDSISKVFERYFRVDDITEQHIGSGIGLALVKNLVLLHSGRLILSSKREKGTEICIMIPVLDFSLGDIVSETENLIHEEPRDLVIIDSEVDSIDVDDEINNKSESKRQTIMLVEDNQQLRELIAGMLSEEYNVKQYANGQVALYGLDNENIDIIVTDLMMPVMDGISFCHEVKGRIETSHLPVVMLTAKGGMDNEIEGLNAGADAYLEKPVNKELLFITLKNILIQRNRLRKFYLKNMLSEENIDIENDKDMVFLNAVTKCIEENMSNSSFDIKMMASSLCVSHSNLFGKVKDLTGHTPGEITRKYRLNKAAKLLLESRLSISEIISLVGIESISYFSRAFKQEFGETPSEYQKKRRQ